MKSLLRFMALAVSLVTTPQFALGAAVPFNAQQVSTSLQSLLSGQNIVSFVAPARWSSYEAPQPALVINPRNELDVAITVGFLSALGIPFLAQNGGVGWATFDLPPYGVLINLARLNSVTFNAAKTEVTVGGGASINQTIAAANAAGALVETGNCNCVGTLGAILGGGYGNLLGIYGFGVDNIISLRLVTPEGLIRTVTPTSDPDLFWAVRGAGPNFGIVTSAVIRSYPANAAARSAWTGSLIYTPDKVEAVVQAIQNLFLEPEMVVFLYFISGGPPSNQPIVMVTPFLYKGNPTTGQQKFASLYAVGPIVDTTTIVPYAQWNSAGDPFCARGPRKPSFGAGFQSLIPSTWRQIWNEFAAFQARPGAENSAVLMEAYSLAKARSVPSTGPQSAAFPLRHVNFNAFFIGWYDDPALDAPANVAGKKIRDLWRATDGLPRNTSYVNFSHGDEALEVVYGDSLPRLKKIKKRIDPANRFDQWFNIK